MASFTEEFGKSATTTLAEKLYKAFKPTDLFHVAFMLKLKNLKGFTHAVAYKLAAEYPEYAKKIVARAVKK